MRRVSINQQNALGIAAAVLLVFAFLAGGASRLNLGRLALVELAALPALVMALTALIRQPGVLAKHRLAFGIVVGLVAIPALQLLPLPPALWTALPGRESSVQALQLVGAPIGWAPMSLVPDATWRSLLALVPPVALFLAMIAGGRDNARRLTLLFLASVLGVIALGALQLVTGTDRFALWAASGNREVVGVFANRNHLATLCLTAIPFGLTIGALSFRRQDEASRLLVWFGPLISALALVALGAANSRAGAVLAVPAVLMSLGAVWLALGRRGSRLMLGGMAALSLAALAAVAILGSGQLVKRFDGGGTHDPRFDAWPVIVKAAPDFLPVGSGIGSFDAVYRSVEPLELLEPAFFNQAHNDFLESWLEAGWLAVALLVAFLIWFGRRGLVAWTRRGGRDGGGRETEALARAAGVAVVLVLAHSVVDYPLRTETMACVFALCCGLIERLRAQDAGRDAG